MTQYLLHIHVASGEDVFYLYDTPAACKSGLMQYVRDWWDDEVNHEFNPDGKPLGDVVTLEDVKLYFEMAQEYANIVIFEYSSSGNVFSAEAFWEYKS